MTLARNRRFALGIAAGVVVVAGASATTAVLLGSSDSQPAVSAPSTTPSTRYPNAKNSGVPTGTVLRDVPGQVRSGAGWSYGSGTVKVTGSGAVLSGLRINGTVTFQGPNQTLAKSEVIAPPGDGAAIQLNAGSSVSAPTIIDSFIHGPLNSNGACANQGTPQRSQYGIFGDSTPKTPITIVSNHIECFDHPLQLEAGDIEDNYVHGITVNCTGGPGCSIDHADVLFSGGGVTQPLKIIHNTLLQDWTGGGCAGCAGDIMLNNAFGMQSNRTIENNLLAGGNFVIYAGQASPPGTNNVIRGNVFSTRYWPNSGVYGPVRDATSDNVFAGNTWSDGPKAGQTIEP
jgi:hypothetical protein